jgi:hypothetical protein
VKFCVVFEFGWFGFRAPLGGTLPALCLGLVRISVAQGTLAEALTQRIKK